ncbi:hypothetical protein [Burkholderia contaminans]|uniref:hypothetical protein n=1 Tax=Burkholderia contaminans TaxID=488447 RepID=UPI0021AB55ED|nr:hypothetical protein [Burkholderia contaminans]
MNGLTPCCKLREENHRDTPDDKLDGSELGADDYLAKPLSFREVGARLGGLVKGYRRQVTETVLC